MTVQRLIELALAKVGNESPTSSQINDAYDHLNMIISNFAYWDAEDQPITSFTSLSQTINLPPHYLAIFEFLLAAYEGITYGISANEIALYEAKAKQLTDRMVYRRNLSAATKYVNPSMQVA